MPWKDLSLSLEVPFSTPRDGLHDWDGPPEFGDTYALKSQNQGWNLCKLSPLLGPGAPYWNQRGAWFCPFDLLVGTIKEDFISNPSTMFTFKYAISSTSPCRWMPNPIPVLKVDGGAKRKMIINAVSGRYSWNWWLPVRKLRNNCLRSSS